MSLSSYNYYKDRETRRACRSLLESCLRTLDSLESPDAATLLLLASSAQAAQVMHDGLTLTNSDVGLTALLYRVLNRTGLPDTETVALTREGKRALRRGVR